MLAPIVRMDFSGQKMMLQCTRKYNGKVKNVRDENIGKRGETKKIIIKKDHFATLLSSVLLFV